MLTYGSNDGTERTTAGPKSEAALAAPLGSVALMWSNSPPLQEGWFFTAARGTTWSLLATMVVLVKRQRAYGRRLCELHPIEGWIPVDEIENAMWAGPIAHPIEPPNDGAKPQPR